MFNRHDFCVMKWAFLSFPFVQQLLVKLLGIWLELSVVTLKRISASPRSCPSTARSSPSLFSQPLCLRKRNVADRPATTVVRPRVQSRKASRPPRKKSENGKRRSARVGTTHRTTISATKTRPRASECDRTNAGASACNKGAKCRGGDGFLGGRIGTAEACEMAHQITRHIRAPHPRNRPSIPAPWGLAHFD